MHGGTSSPVPPPRRTRAIFAAPPGQKLHADYSGFCPEWLADLYAACSDCTTSAEMAELPPDRLTGRERRKLEKGLLNWLKQRSLAQLFDGFDCLEETKVDT